MIYKKIKINKKQENIHFRTNPTIVEFKRSFKFNKGEKDI